MKVAPSILSADFSILKDELKTLKAADWIHVDVMDGHFVPNLTIGPGVVKALRPHSNQPFDTHLMIENPHEYVDAFIDAGSDHVTFHIETVKSPHMLIDHIHEKGAKAGISIKPMTTVEAITPFLDSIEIVLVMSVEPGFGGQAFMPEMVDKMQELSDIRARDNLDFTIVVDGGINDETAKQCLNAGVDVLVAGSYIFKAKDREKAIASLRP